MQKPVKFMKSNILIGIWFSFDKYKQFKNATNICITGKNYQIAVKEEGFSI